MSELHERLRRQSLGRPLTADEEALAQAMEKIFRSGEQDFEALAQALTRDGVNPVDLLDEGERGALERRLFEAA